MNVIDTDELERLVRETFPAKPRFSAEADLGMKARRSPVVTVVHGGPDPFLDRQLEAWLRGVQRFVAAHQILNGLCRAGVLPPGSTASRSVPATGSPDEQLVEGEHLARARRDRRRRGGAPDLWRPRVVVQRRRHHRR